MRWYVSKRTRRKEQLYSRSISLGDDVLISRALLGLTSRSIRVQCTIAAAARLGLLDPIAGGAGVVGAISAFGIDSLLTGQALNAGGSPGGRGDSRSVQFGSLHKQRSPHAAGLWVHGRRSLAGLGFQHLEALFVFIPQLLQLLGVLDGLDLMV